MISEWLSTAFLILGALLMLIASLGIIRLPDIYLRMHAATKAPSLGIFFMVLAVIIYFAKWWPAIEAVLILVFIFITIPVGSHMISRVAHLMMFKKSDRTVMDEMTETPAGNKPSTGRIKPEKNHPKKL